MKYDEDWYNNLIKSKFCPPIWVFKLVWTLIYILMVIAFCLTLVAKFRLINIFAYLLFIAQFLVNLQWSPAFFEEHNLRKSFLLSALLTLLVFMTMLFFFKVSKLAGILFLPYFLWCSFTTLLDFAILELNEW